jgi:hypothetical protein
MTEEEFEALIDRHGGDPSRWPAAERAAAEQRLAESSKARATLAAMREVEHLLDATRAAAPDPGRILAQATAMLQRPPLRATVRRSAAIAASAAAVLLLGFGTGQGAALASHDAGALYAAAMGGDIGG